MTFTLEDLREPRITERNYLGSNLVLGEILVDGFKGDKADGEVRNGGLRSVLGRIGKGIQVGTGWYTQSDLTILGKLINPGDIVAVGYRATCHGSIIPQRTGNCFGLVTPLTDGREGRKILVRQFGVDDEKYEELFQKASPYRG